MIVMKNMTIMMTITMIGRRNKENPRIYAIDAASG